MRTLTVKSSIVIISLFFLIGCKKDLYIPESISVEQPATEASIPPFPLDWETADYMPTPVGSPILVPWGSGSTQIFDPAIAFDFKKSDGWELVYNIFNTTAMTTPYYFVLYNKFRALMRIYLYLPSMSVTPSTYFNHGLSLSGSGTSSMLNYIGQDIVNVETNLTTTTQIEKRQIQSTGGWHVMQYEIAYDPNIAGASYTNLNFVWTARTINITEVNLFGTVNGTLKGTITQPGAGIPSLGTSATNFVKSALQAVSIAAVQTELLGIPTDIHNAFKTALDKGLQGIVQNIFSAIFGGSSGTTQQVNLTLSANIALGGTMTNSSGIASPTLVIPGISNSQTAPGYTPGYNKTMGVFYLSAKPKVNVHNTFLGAVPGGGYGYTNQVSRHDYTIDASSFQTLFNPGVINGNSDGAHIENYKQEFIYFGPYIGGYGSWIAADGVTETVGTANVQVGGTYSQKTQMVGYGIPPNIDHGPLALRYSFDVVPNNGGPRVKMVKTFWATPVYI